MSDDSTHEQFVLEMLDCQRRLHDYIFALVFDRDRAGDVLQQTNMALLRKKSEFTAGTNFSAWALRVAYFEVLADRRRRYRDRHLFNDDLLELIADHAEQASASGSRRTEALAECLERLTADQRQLVDARYGTGGSVESLAHAAKKTPAAISSVLYRIRMLLVECVERKLGSNPS